MGLLDSVSSLGASSNLIGSISSGINSVSNLGTAISTAYNSGDGGDVMAAIRAFDLPAAGEVLGDLESAVASFGGDANEDDWRVRLSLANWASFRSSPVLTPLKDAGGLIFPYTPQITITSSAAYTPVETVHTNYKFNAFKQSDPGSISIIAPMYVTDPTEGLYWIAMVHYLRSLTKMFAGSDPKAGNPPPVVMLNGYGNYVFKNVPVVVTKMSVQLDAGSDYIGVNVVGSAAGELEGLTEGVGGLADSLGSAIPGLGGITSVVSDVAGGLGQVAALAGTFGLGGSVSGGVAHVPTKSSFTVELTPIYSRNSARKFSLDRFVQGGYLNNSFGYI